MAVSPPPPPAIVAFAAPSGTGKTTVIEQIVRVLVGQGLRVGVIKSDAHRMVLDRPGKDSWRFAEAGASPVTVLGSDRQATFQRLDGDVSLLSVVERHYPGVDLVLAEGFRQSGLPSLRVFRQAGPSAEGWAPPRNLVGWISDVPLETNLPVLPLGDAAAVATWIVSRYVRHPAPEPITVVVPCSDPHDLPAARAALARITAEVRGASLLVAPRSLPLPTDAASRWVYDLKPGLGLLGALFTALAAADTGRVLLLGPRHRDVPADVLARLMDVRHARADLVWPDLDGHREPACTIYGAACLGAIHAALRSGETRMTGWWGQVRAQRVPISDVA